MAKWYYFDEEGKRTGPVRGRDIKQLAWQGTVTPETRVENEKGQIGYAKDIVGLKFLETAQSAISETMPSELSTVMLPPSAEVDLYATATSVEPNPSTTAMPVQKYQFDADTTNDAMPQSIPTSDNWYYYDIKAQKQGPYHIEQIRQLARRGTITPGTYIVTQKGKSIPAKKVSGLVFAEDIQLGVAMQKQRRLYIVVLGLVLGMFSFTGIWWIVVGLWLIWGIFLAIILVPLMAMDSASKTINMFD